MQATRTIALILALIGGNAVIGQAPSPPVVPTPAPAPTPTPAPAPTPKIDPIPVPSPLQAKSAIVIASTGGPVPETWPLGVSLTLSPKTAIAGPGLGAVDWWVDDVWTQKYSTKNPLTREYTVESGTQPHSIVVWQSVAMGDTQDRSAIKVRFVRDPNEPGVVPAPVPVPDLPPVTPVGPPAPPLIDPLITLGGKIDHLATVIVKLSEKIDAMPRPVPTPDPGPGPVVPPAPVVPPSPAFTGPLNVVLIYDLNGVDEPTTAVRISPIKTELAALKATWHAYDAASAEAAQFRAYMDAKKINVPAVFIVDDKGNLKGGDLIPFPTTREAIIARVKSIQGVR